MKMFRTAALSGAAILLGLSACEKVPDASQAETPAQKADLANLVETLGKADNLSDARDLIKEAGLDDALEGPAPYTLFLPSNEALGAINKDELSRLKSKDGRPELIALLRYHIAPGVLAQQDLANAISNGGGSVTIANVGGSDLEFSQQGQRIGIGKGDQAALLTGAPLVAGNGVIYTVDRLIVPEGAGGPAPAPQAAASSSTS